MLSAFFTFAYFLLLLLTFVGLSKIKTIPYSPEKKILIFLFLIITVLIIQSLIFGGLYKNIYSTSRNMSFTGSEIYKTRKQEEAVKELWLSKDIKSNFFFPNWELLEINNRLNNEGKKDLEQFYDAYKSYYGIRLDYDQLRNKLSREFSDLIIHLKKNPFPPYVASESDIINLPAVKEFLIRLNFELSNFDSNLDPFNNQSPLNKEIALRFLTVLSELSTQISVSRLDILLSVKSNEIFVFLRGHYPSLQGREKEAVYLIEKTLFFNLARKFLVSTEEVPARLEFKDFFYYSALSFLSAGSGDIQPVSPNARMFTFLQVLGTFIILALAIAFLSNPIEGLNKSSLVAIKKILRNGLIFSAVLLACTILFKAIQNNIAVGVNNEILKSDENYGYSPKMDGTVDVFINVNSPNNSQNLSKHFVLSMPYQAIPGSDVRFPGILISKQNSRIVWAELFPPTTNGIYIYGDGYNIGQIKEPYKIFISGSFTAY